MKNYLNENTYLKRENKKTEVDRKLGDRDIFSKYFSQPFTKLQKRSKGDFSEETNVLCNSPKEKELTLEEHLTSNEANKGENSNVQLKFSNYIENNKILKEPGIKLTIGKLTKRWKSLGNLSPND